MRLCDVGAAIQEVMESYEIELGHTYSNTLTNLPCDVTNLPCDVTNIRTLVSRH